MLVFFERVVAGRRRDSAQRDRTLSPNRLAAVMWSPPGARPINSVVTAGLSFTTQRMFVARIDPAANPKWAATQLGGRPLSASMTHRTSVED